MAKTDSSTKNEDMRRGNVSLILDSYEDLFSDFDPRPYSEKAISDDFLQECKRAARDKEGGFELELLVPQLKRNTTDEIVIKRRLKNHFQKHFKQKHKEITRMREEGILWVIVGCFFMATTTIVKTYSASLLTNFLIILLEPAGWFSFWEGLAKIFIQSRKEKPEQSFYMKMADIDVSFSSY